MDAYEWAVGIRFTGSILTLVLGLLVGLAGPRNRMNQAFVLWAFGVGSWGVLVDVPWPASWDGLLTIFYPVSTAALVAGLAVLGARFPEAPRVEERGLMFRALGFGVLLYALVGIRFLIGGSEGPLSWFGIFLNTTRSVAVWTFLMLVALRAMHAQDVRPYALVTVVLVPAAAVSAGGYLYPWPGLSGLARLSFHGFGLATVVLVAVLWARTLIIARSRWATAVVWTILGFAFLTMLTLGAEYSETWWGYAWLSIQGVARIVGASVFAYFVVRGQVPGLDRKVRWTVSRSTVAAAFVAAFFIASEGAQILFGRQNELVGLFAAGALVFAIAPLQRAAERLAAKAVPVNSASMFDGAVNSTSNGGREAIFCRAVRLALRDGELSRNEERELVAIAFDLRLPPERAFELRDEVVGKAQRVHLEETP